MGAGFFSYQIHVRGRGEGYNAVAHASYVAGEKLKEYRGTAHVAYIAGEPVKDRATGTTHRYGSAERVMHREITVPGDAPKWAQGVAAKTDNEELWNRVEAAEKRKDAQIYRTVILAIDDGFFVRGADGRIDAEASRKRQADMVREHVRTSFVDHGMVASWAIHWDPKKPESNPHAHVMLTMREVTEDGFGKKNRSWNDRTHIENWRGHWADVQNRELQRQGANYRTDHRSYRRQGVENLEAQPKTWGRDKQERRLPEPVKRQVEQDRLTKKQRGERLIADAKPVLQVLSGHYRGDFSRGDLETAVGRFAATADQRQRLLAAVERSSELVRLPNGSYTTQGILARQAARDIEPALPRLREARTWQELDRTLAASGWRMEAASREKRTAHDLVSLAEPERRVSAWRVNRDLGPQALENRLGSSRVRHELGQIRENRQQAYRDLRGRVWARMATQQRHERAEFQKAWNDAMRDEWKRGLETGQWTVGERVAYRVSKWVWERREQRLKARQEAGIRRAQEKIDRLRGREAREVPRTVEQHEGKFNAAAPPSAPSPAGQDPPKKEPAVPTTGSTGSSTSSAGRTADSAPTGRQGDLERLLAEREDVRRRMARKVSAGASNRELAGIRDELRRIEGELERHPGFRSPDRDRDPEHER